MNMKKLLTLCFSCALVSLASLGQSEGQVGALNEYSHLESDSPEYEFLSFYESNASFLMPFHEEKHRHLDGELSIPKDYNLKAMGLWPISNESQFYLDPKSGKVLVIRSHEAIVSRFQKR